MGRFAVKCNAHIDTGLDRGEFDPGLSITKGILDQLRLDDLRVRSSKIEAHAAVLSLHAGGKFATLSQIDGGSGRVPSLGRCIPLFNVMRRRIGPPDLTNVRRDIRLDCDSPSFFLSVLWFNKPQIKHQGWAGPALPPRLRLERL